MSHKPGDTLATHPQGFKLVAYENDGLWSAVYTWAGIVLEHPDNGFGVFDGQHWLRLTTKDIAAIQTIAPDATMPPLWPLQAGLIAFDDLTANGAFFVDWGAFWAAEHDETTWLYEPIIAKGRGHAIFAGHKVGKSLVLLTISLQLATGPEPIVVIYLDYEMSRDDLEERLIDMGADHETDLSRLRYALIPALPALDTQAGADALLAIVDEEQAAWPDHHILVVLDTTARAVAGEENSADTIRAFYRFTGAGLKRRQVTWARLDHAGKDPTKGQRGSSAKGDDVDVIWRVAAADQRGLKFTREASRMSWVPEMVNLARHDEPLRFEITDKPGWPAGTAEKAAILDDLGAPADISVRDAQRLIKDSGISPGTNSVLAAAVKYRKQQPDLGDLVTTVTPGNAVTGDRNTRRNSAPPYMGERYAGPDRNEWNRNDW